MTIHISTLIFWTVGAFFVGFGIGVRWGKRTLIWTLESHLQAGGLSGRQAIERERDVLDGKAVD